MNMDDVLKAARRATAANKLFEASKPVPKKPVSRLEALQKRFDQLVGMHTATEALLAAGGGDLPASLPLSRRSMSPEAAPSLPLPPRSAGGSPCYAIGEQPGVERGPRLRLQPSISTRALRRHGPSPGPRAAAPQAQDAPMCTVAMRTQPACGAPSPERNAPVPQVCRGRPAWLLRLRVQPAAAELRGRSGGARAPRRRRHLAARDAVRQWRCYCLLVWRAQLVWRPSLRRPLFVWLVAHARAAEEQLAPLHVRPLRVRRRDGGAHARRRSRGQAAGRAAARAGNPNPNPSPSPSPSPNPNPNPNPHQVGLSAMRALLRPFLKVKECLKRAVLQDFARRVEQAIADYP